ncbi:hypothetical protein J4864_00880 [Prevotella multiformis]|uniref:hypothetical protein n=1 Tax=Prevotella multiformis TaxID=282402 RepID=UPI001BAC29A5|nr:hypothetical protein [Prevotella multiformis]QUB70818.1 hypothetical protein J4864_00880 [Prevotella multiformis]
MSKIKKHKNTATQKAQEPIGTRIAKAVFEEKKISERIFGYISYDINFIKATYAGKTQRPAKITSLEKGIVGILLVDGTSSFKKIGLILGLDVVNDKAEQSILRTAIDTLRGFNAIEGDDSCMALTDAGRTYASKGERPDTYTKSFDIYVDKSHLSWLNIKNCIGDNLSKINEINTPCDNLNLSLEQIKQYAECQAQDVHFPQNRYLLESAIWSEGHEASYKVYVCFVQSIASSEEVRAFVFDENSNTLNHVMSEQINSNPELLSELLENCIRFECEIDEETIVLEGDAIETAKSEISEDIKEAEKQLLLEEENAQNAPLSDTKAESSRSANTDKERLHKKALYDSLSFELELQKIFNEDDPDEIWLISPWIRKGAFMHDRGPLIENFLKDENKRVFIAYSEPASNNDGKPMIDEEVEPGIKLLDEQYPNFFYVQLPEFHLKNVIEVKGDQKVLFSGSFNVLSFSVSEEQKHIRREEMTLAHHTVAKNKYVDFQLEFAEIYASRIQKKIESLEVTSLANYKNERLDYFLNVDNPKVHKLFSPIEDLLEEKVLGCLKAELHKKLTKIEQELVVASNMGGLNMKDKKRYKSSLESISKDLSSNSIDDPSIIELLESCLNHLDVVPDKKIFPGKVSPKTARQPFAPRQPQNSTMENLDTESASILEVKTMVSEAMDGSQHGTRITIDSVAKAKKMCSPTNIGLENIDKLFKVLAGTNVLASAIKVGIEKKMRLADVHNSLRRIVKKCEDFDNLSIIYNNGDQKRIIFDVEGIQFQYEKFEVNDELMMFINSHNNRVTRWNGSRTFLFSVEIIEIATKYKIE